MSQDLHETSVTWEICATSFEATDLARVAHRVIGMEVRRRSVSPEGLGSHSGCVVARVQQGAGQTPRFLVDLSYDARPQAANNLTHILTGVVSGCLVMQRGGTRSASVV